MYMCVCVCVFICTCGCFVYVHVSAFIYNMYMYMYVPVYKYILTIRRCVDIPKLRAWEAALSRLDWHGCRWAELNLGVAVRG